jgi:hypothetical protein
MSPNCSTRSILSQGSSTHRLHGRPAAKVSVLVFALCIVSHSTGRQGIHRRIRKGSQEGIASKVLRKAIAATSITIAGSRRIEIATNGLGRYSCTSISGFDTDDGWWGYRRETGREL